MRDITTRISTIKKFSQIINTRVRLGAYIKDCRKSSEIIGHFIGRRLSKKRTIELMETIITTSPEIVLICPPDCHGLSRTKDGCSFCGPKCNNILVVYLKKPRLKHLNHSSRHFSLGKPFTTSRNFCVATLNFG